MFAPISRLQRSMLDVDTATAAVLLCEAWVARDTTPELLAEVVGWAWQEAEYPEDLLGRQVWIAMFQEAGYTVAGPPPLPARRAPRPVEPIRLYRGGATWDRMAWSSSLTRARVFASDEHGFRPRTAVWTAMIEPEWLLAQLHGRYEDEYVVDPDGLTRAELVSDQP